MFVKSTSTVAIAYQDIFPLPQRIKTLQTKQKKSRGKPPLDFMLFYIEFSSILFVKEPNLYSNTSSILFKSLLLISLLIAII